MDQRFPRGEYKATFNALWFAGSAGPRRLRHA
jgi:hypothetical protein